MTRLSPNYRLLSSMPAPHKVPSQLQSSHKIWLRSSLLEAQRSIFIMLPTECFDSSSLSKCISARVSLGDHAAGHNGACLMSCFFEKVSNGHKTIVFKVDGHVVCWLLRWGSLFVCLSVWNGYQTNTREQSLSSLLARSLIDHNKGKELVVVDWYLLGYIRRSGWPFATASNSSKKRRSLATTAMEKLFAKWSHSLVERAIPIVIHHRYYRHMQMWELFWDQVLYPTHSPTFYAFDIWFF